MMGVCAPHPQLPPGTACPCIVRRVRPWFAVGEAARGVAGSLRLELRRHGAGGASAGLGELFGRCL